MVERLRIARLGAHGEGVADTAAGAVYVPYALPGEIAEVEPWPGHADRRHLTKVEVASPERIAPVCGHFGVCGGCALQHLASARYRDWKRGLVVTALARAGVDAPVDDLIDAHGEGRRRAVFHARRSARDVLEVGFAALKAHHVVGIDRCPVLAPALSGALPTAWDIAEVLASTRKPLDIQATATDAGLDVDVRGSGPLTAAQTAALAQVAERRNLVRLARHGEIVAHRAPPVLTIGRAEVVLPPGAFLQATTAAEAILARLVASHCRGAARVVDLFCGVGPFALRLAERAHVTAIDSDADALAALRRGAAGSAGLKPVTAQQRDLFRYPLGRAEFKAFEAVVFDPPRQGAQAQARELAASGVAKVTAVSCDPSSFARDARILLEGGYRLAQVTPVDQFLFSRHVELVAYFEK
ncbi:MAG TPA: methyltransferase domain-containing protein [Xanthobacteraceae bacterium]|jgi:23S rRNA (uracil1939-C5)-methyltransferase|nr:methyltransferase domain-containing protein [Xanthobacteraceae bacterium]